jgi:poly(hydroxyalkanoate) depolymerase family esterase
MTKRGWLRVVTAAVVLCCTLVGRTPAHAAVGPGSFVEATHPGVGATGPRDYWVYEPTTPATGPRPLVVYLHGCSQTGPDAAIGTRWNELAETAGFLVVYPEQSAAANGAQCWNWFLPEHQARGAGEPAVIAAITADVIASHDVDPSRVYVLGASAGADMAIIMGATYPDVYAAIGAFAGCAYATCTDRDGTAAHAAMAERSRVVPAFLAQGSADMLNDYALGKTMETQAVATNDLADDGLANDSVPADPSSSEDHGFDRSMLDGVGHPGDVCVRNRQFPCAAGALGLTEYPYTVDHHATADGCSVVDFATVYGLNHDYPGGDPAGTFTDPVGPAATPMAWDFFRRQSLDTAPCHGLDDTTTPVVPELPSPAVALVGAALLAAVAMRRRVTARHAISDRTAPQRR